MRLERIWAYSLCQLLVFERVYEWTWVTYGSILGRFRAAALECDAVALVLETLGSDQALDLGGLGVGLRALLLGLNLAADDKLADL